MLAAGPQPAGADLDVFAADSTAQSIEGLPIRRVDIDPRNIYDPVPDGFLSPLYRTLDRLHVRTRRRTVKSQLLFGPGDLWSDAKGRETERQLRSLTYLTPHQMVTRAENDSVDVLVVTHDVWTTTPEFNLAAGGGKHYGSAAFTERNLLGLGKSLSFTYSHDPVGVSRYFSYHDPNVLSSHVQLRFVTGDGADGATHQFSIGQPFYSMDASRTAGFSTTKTNSQVVLYERASEVARFDRGLQETEVWWGFGGWKDSTIRRFTGSFFMLDRRYGPTEYLAGAPPEFVGGEESLRLRRLAVEMRLWHPRYVERTFVDQLGLTEDFDIGTSLSLKAGFSPEFLGSTQSEGYVRAALDQGVRTPVGFGWAQASVSSRVLTNPLETIGQIRAKWVSQSFHDRQTFALGVVGTGSARPARDYQIVVGALNGLRAYPVQAVSGTRVWRANGEERLVLADLFSHMMTIGGVAFADAARAWGPGSDGSEWFLDAGGGLRASFPQWTLGRVLRFDIAWPMTPTRDQRREPVFSIGSSQAF